MKVQSFVLFVLLFSVPLAFAPTLHGQDELTLSEEATEYLHAALDIMEENSVNREIIDWETLRSTAFRRAKGAQAPSDTYNAIKASLRSLKDNHSFFVLPQPSGQQTADAEAGPPPPFDEPTGSLVSEGVALLTIPAHSGLNPPANQVRYAEILHELISSYAASGVLGWIVDLRGNGGGNMWPMLAGLGPLLGEGTVGSFTYPNDAPSSLWTYNDGASFLEASPIVEVADSARCSTIDPPPPVAVLIDRVTASSGEATAIAFAGRESTRFFGTATRGLSTGNRGFELSDGAVIILTTCVFADRTGKTYGRAVKPDQTTTAGQPTLDAAIEWIRDQL